MNNQMDISKYCLVVGSTDVGRKRAVNEDSMGNFETCNGLVSVVCDGMGGHVGGATASRIAVDTIHSFLDGQYYSDAREAIGMAIDAANKAILSEAAVRPELRGMGSTCVLLLVREGKVYIGHVGDSRIYLIRGNTIYQLTKDHSYVQMLVDCNQITEEQAEHHPRKNEITNALGIPDMTPATIKEEAMTPEAGDCFLLCSDGLSGMVDKQEILSIVCRRQDMGTQARADYLVRRANEHGGLDNITVQLVEFASVPGASIKTSIIHKKKFWLIGLIALMIIVGGVVAWLLRGCGSDSKQGETTNDTLATNVSQTKQFVEKNSKLKEEIELGKVYWEKEFRFVTVKYNQASAILTLLQKENGKIGIETLKEIEIQGEFTPASLSCNNSGVIFGSQGSDLGYIDFGKKEPINREIEFVLTAKDSTVHPFKVFVEDRPQKETKPNKTDKKQEQGSQTEAGNESESIIEKVVGDVQDQLAPIEYSVTLFGDTEKPFLTVEADKYKYEGGEAKISLGMILPQNSDAVTAPTFVEAKWENNRIVFRLNTVEGVDENFKIRLKTVEKDNPGKPVNVIFNCELKKQ